VPWGLVKVMSTENLVFASATETIGLGETSGACDGLTNSWDSDLTLQQRFANQLRHLNEIGLALSSERDINCLLEKILLISRELTGADAGSLFLVQPDEKGEPALYFREAQNDSVKLSTVMTFTVGPSSLAGYVAQTGEPLCLEDVYAIPEGLPYQFNPGFDRQSGYRTKSVLVVPLRNRSGDIVGVLQLINRKARRDAVLNSDAAVAEEVLPFDNESVELAASIASQAAVALENTQLLTSIQGLVESFVRASSSAIEDRDPSTSGHSRRVTALTLGLAEAINEETEGPYAEIFFTQQQLKELRYAGLLHDFGKIGVREAVLTKSHKLDPSDFEVVRYRLMMVRQKWFYEGLDVAEIDSLFELLAKANDPAVTFLPDPQYSELQKALERLAALRYSDEKGVEHPVITEAEAAALSIRKGSLTRDEFVQIQQHAELSFQFLRQIAWTPDLANVPAIAHAHHEKLSGRGYPLGITAEHILLQSRLMTVADIYDALTAADRPYKKSMPLERALGILRAEAASGDLDTNAVELFIRREIWRLTAAETPGAIS